MTEGLPEGIAPKREDAIVKGLEPTCNSLLKSKLGIKPTEQKRAYTTGIAIANEKKVFFAIFGYHAAFTNFPLIVGIVDATVNNASPHPLVAMTQADCL